MTSDDIKNAHPMDRSTNDWLREVAYQLALLNEKPAATPPKPQQQPARR